ncbi:MAG: inositol monophosphatase family protein [Pseudomonadota bacterium]
MTASLPDLRSFFRHLAGVAAAETLPRFRSETAITDKGGLRGEAYDPVTEADREAERMLRVAIEEAYPDHGIYGEEFADKIGSSEYRWVIDPVDGTRAFVCGVPTWTTLIGLEQEGAPVGGSVSQPLLDEQWVTVPSEGTMLRRGGEELPARTSGETALGNATIMVTDIRAGEYLSTEESAAVTGLTRSCRLCRQGLDSYAFGLLASGHMDLVVEAGLSWYDIAAALPVVEGAGGVACTWTGERVTPGFVRGRVILAASRALADQAVSRLRDTPLP